MSEADRAAAEEITLRFNSHLQEQTRAKIAVYFAAIIARHMAPERAEAAQSKEVIYNLSRDIDGLLKSKCKLTSDLTAARAEIAELKSTIEHLKSLLSWTPTQE